MSPSDSITALETDCIDRLTMARIEQTAIHDFGIRRDILLDSAGRGAAAALRRMRAEPGRIVVAAGAGHNGGCGLAAVRHLLAAGHDVVVLLAAQARDLEEASKRQLDVVERLGVTVFGADVLDDLHVVDNVVDRLTQADIVLDALAGPDQRGGLAGAVRRVADAFDAAGCTVLSLDLPSGVDADDGTIHPGAVRADVTVSLALPKRGVAKAGPEETGLVFLATLGLPPQVFQRAGVQVPLPLFDDDGLVLWPTTQ